MNLLISYASIIGKTAAEYDKRSKSVKYNNIKIKKYHRFDLQRKVVSHMTSSSWQNIPHVSYIYEPDITDFYEEFIKLIKKRQNTGCKISFNTIMMRIIIEGLLKAPDLNAYVEYNHKKGEGTTYILDEINISVAWQLPDGKMITPAVLN